jgi:C-terminal processing protease CtpA/Prc
MTTQFFTRCAAVVMAIMPFALTAQTVSDPFAPEGSTTIRIAVEREVNGVTVKTDTTLVLAPGADLNGVLEQFGLGSATDLDGQGEDLEIIINKRSGLSEDLQELRLEFNELLPDLRDLQSVIRDVQDQIVLFQAPQNANRAFLGIYFEPTQTAEGYGAKVTQVMEGSGAEQAGLQVGDEILAVDGQRLRDDADLRSILMPFEPGDEVELFVLRQDGSETESLRIRAVLGSANEARAFQWQNDDKTFEFQWDEGDLDFQNLPFAFDDVTSMALTSKPFLGVYLDYSSVEGVRISGAIAGTTAEELGLKKGDVLYEINGETFSDIAGLKEVLSRQTIGEPIVVEYLRDGKKEKAKGILKANTDSLQQGSVRIREGLMGPIGSLEEMIQQEVIRSGQVVSEELQKDLEQLRALEDLEIFFSGEENGAGSELLREFPTRIVRRVAVFITMDNLSEADVEQLNQHARPPVTAENDLAVEGVFFSPNPNDGQFILNYALQESGPVQVQLYDIAGRSVFAKAFEGTPGSYSEQINISDEPKGVYFLTVVQNGKSFAKKVVIQ